VPAGGKSDRRAVQFNIRSELEARPRVKG